MTRGQKLLGAKKTRQPQNQNDTPPLDVRGCVWRHKELGLPNGEEEIEELDYIIGADYWNSRSRALWRPRPDCNHRGWVGLWSIQADF